MFDQYRWYYNATLTILYNYYGYENITNKNKYSNITVRDILRKHYYNEEKDEHLVFQSFILDENRNEPLIPPWWMDDKPHSRISRGASDKFTSSLNSAISNYKNKNTRSFKMSFMTKKKQTEYLHFEDSQYPSFIKKIQSNYWFTTKERKRINMSFSDIVEQTRKRGLEIIYEKETNKYFLHYPVDRNWFPEEDRRNDSQVKFVPSDENRIISLDPGVRKFLVGYDPSGNSIFIGEKAHIDLTCLLYEIDNESDKKKSFVLWKKVKNMIHELHWKTISFLIENYDTILLPDFRVSQMVKGKKLAKITKRLMCMFSFFSFKEKLKEKCIVHRKKLIIVDESFTSCTCGRCGVINNTKGNEVYQCISCNLIIDRDVTGSRNIFIKNSSLRCSQI